MRLVEHATEALRNLAHAKLRSMLALLGVLVGTASVVAMVSGGELATQEALRQFKSLGTDLLAVSMNPSSDTGADAGKSGQLSLSDALSIHKIDVQISQVAPYTQVYHPVTYQGNEINSMVLGVTDQFADVVKIKLWKGRFVSLLDQYASYCVIGRQIYDKLKQLSFKEPLGQSIQIGNTIFKIIGVADTWQENNFVYTDVNNAILIPIMTSMMLSKYAAINNIIMQLSPEADIAAVESHLTSAINSVVPNQQIMFRSAKELIAKMKKQNDILTIFLGLIGSISLLVGGIGVMNIMLVSVIERKREIGIRRAIGARRRDITLLFLVEAVMLSLLGGAAGVVIGMLIAYLIAVFSHWEFTLFLWPACAGFLVSVLVGVVAGFYPAWQAAKLAPIDALRSE